MSKPKVIVLATKGLSTNLLIQRLEESAELLAVFIEKPVSKKQIITRRIKKIGWFKTLGQLSFLSLVLPLIPQRKKRIASILKANNLKDNYRFPYKNIESVHDTNLVKQINALNPDLIVINGTRILKKEFIENVAVKIINIHVGITPKYRGIHGGFWAIYHKDLENCGVTLHYVDAGIDTGNIIAQRRISPRKSDNFKTYPILQYINGLDLLQEQMTKIIDGETAPFPAPSNTSQLHYHPTIWQYLFGPAK